MCGEDVDSVDHSGCTPLYAAAVGNHHEVVELLIKAGANVNIRDKNVRRIIKTLFREFLTSVCSVTEFV
jgi:ankyrin repeat protein